MNTIGKDSTEKESIIDAFDPTWWETPPKFPQGYGDEAYYDFGKRKAINLQIPSTMQPNLGTREPQLPHTMIHPSQP